MVFESITKSISEVTDKVTQAAGTVTNPIKDVSASVSKTVMGPKLDILEQSHDLLALNALIDEYKSSVTKTATQLKKNKVTATKITTLKKVLLGFELSHGSYSELSKSLIDYLEEIKKKVHEGLQVIDYKDKEFVTNKSRKWTAAEKSALEVAMTALIKHTSESIDTVGSLAEYYTEPFTKVVDQKKLMETAKKQLDDNHKQGLNTSADLVGSRRSYSSLLQTIEKNQKKLTFLQEKRRKVILVDKKHVDVEIESLKNANKALLSKDGTALLKSITELEKSLSDHYKKESDILHTFVSSYKELQSSIFAWQSSNLKATGGYMSSVASNKAKNKKQLDTHTKKDEEALKKIESLVKEPYTLAQAFTKTYNEQITTHNACMEFHTQQIATKYAQFTHGTKDIVTKKRLVAAHRTYIYDYSVLLKIASIYTSFANRYHKKHVSLAKEAWNKLLDLKRANSDLIAPYLVQVQQKAEFYNELIKTNTTNTRTYKSSVDSLKKGSWTLVRLQSLIDEELLWISEKQKIAVMPMYSAVLSATEKSLIAHNKKLLSSKSAIISAMKMTENKIKDKEKTLSVKSTKTLKKEIEDLYKMKSNQEAFLDLFEHYKEELEHHITELKDLHGGYEKAIKGAKQDCKNRENRIKYLTKKVSKSPLLKELHWSSALSMNSATV